MKIKLLSEFLGSAGLLVVVVGSGIMGEQLSQGSEAVALLANSLATGAGLYALIQTFGPISGAYFNPVVSFVEWLWGRISGKELFAYASIQILGAFCGVWLTHFLFAQAIFQNSTRDRGDFRFLISEIVASFGLVLVIALSGKRNVEATPTAIALYITSAYWCTSSTSFANPAVTMARSMTDTFSGILVTGVPGFIVAQFLGATLAYWVSQFFSKGSRY